MFRQPLNHNDVADLLNRAPSAKLLSLDESIKTLVVPTAAGVKNAGENNALRVFFGHITQASVDLAISDVREDLHSLRSALSVT